MDLNEQMKLIDKLSYCKGVVKGIVRALKVFSKKELDKSKLIQLLEIVEYNLEEATKAMIQDKQEE